MKKVIHFFAFPFFTVWLLSSCKKEATDNSVIPVNLEIRLDRSYLPVTKIDSAVLLWEAAGQSQQRKFSLTGDRLLMPLKELNSGEGWMTVQIYSQVTYSGAKLQFEKRRKLKLDDQNAITETGPHGFNDPAWMPRVILQEKEWTGLTAIVGLRPSDPYFSIRNIPERWPLVGLSRGYYQKNGGQLVAEKIWHGGGTTRPNLEDRTFFSDLPSRIETKTWAWINIDLDIYSLTENNSFSLSYACPR